MNPTTSTTGVTFVAAAQLLAAHLADHVLPQPASLIVTTRDRRSEVTVQLDSLTMPMVAVELLAWADTLTTVTIGVWRPPAGDRVHLSLASTLTGRQPVSNWTCSGGRTIRLSHAPRATSWSRIVSKGAMDAACR